MVATHRPSRSQIGFLLGFHAVISGAFLVSYLTGDSDDAYFMLLTEPFFRGFTKRELCDTTRQTEALLALSCRDREEVDELVKKAVAAGGSHAMDAVALGGPKR